MISEFYDGIQLFKSKIQSFWPLMISILNLPLSMRNKPGVGTFLVSVFLGKLNTAAERFILILEECLGSELIKFNEGILFKSNNIYNFVQIRMISTILDTKGFEDTLHVQVTNSYAGCMLCNLGKGHYIGNKKISLIGHRAALDIRHFLRVIGQSERCCPENYYF